MESISKLVLLIIVIINVRKVEPNTFVHRFKLAYHIGTSRQNYFNTNFRVLGVTVSVVVREVYAQRNKKAYGNFMILSSQRFKHNENRFV